MRLIAKAALGALALASFVTASASAQSYTVRVGPPAIVVEPRRDPCLRAPEFRPAFCFRHERRYEDRFAFNHEMRDRMWREHMRHEADRQAFLDRRYWDMTH